MGNFGGEIVLRHLCSEEKEAEVRCSLVQRDAPIRDVLNDPCRNRETERYTDIYRFFLMYNRKKMPDMCFFLFNFDTISLMGEHLFLNYCILPCVWPSLLSLKFAHLYKNSHNFFALYFNSKQKLQSKLCWIWKHNPLSRHCQISPSQAGLCCCMTSLYAQTI